jgi:zinc/manganese transport system ATP-binding protein
VDSSDSGPRRRSGMSVVTLARAGARPLGRIALAAAKTVGIYGRAAFVRCLDAGYAPDDAVAPLAGLPGSLLGSLPGSPGDRTLEVRNLSVSYGRRPAVENLAGSFPPASLTAIVGPNGAGKSTLLKALAGIVRTRRGDVVRPARPGRLAYLPQQAELDRGFPITVGELVALGGWRNFGAFRSPPPALAARVADAIEAVGLGGRSTRPIAALSAGQFQRALFARLLVQDAALLLLDEPFTGIDERTSEDLLRLLRRWQEEGRTVVAVLHDLAQVRAHFPTTLLLARRCIAWGDTVGVLTLDNLARARDALDGGAGAAPGQAA